MIEGGFIRSNGISSVSQKIKVVWVSMSWKSSMMLYWPNKFGGWHPIMIHYFLDFSKPNFIQTGQSLMLRITWDRMHGKASLRVVISLEGVRGGGLAMAHQFRFTKTNGYQALIMIASPLLLWTLPQMPRSPFLSTMISANRERMRWTGYLHRRKLLLSKPSLLVFQIRGT